jgi:hypothetical protein
MDALAEQVLPENHNIADFPIFFVATCPSD